LNMEMTVKKVLLTALALGALVATQPVISEAEAAKKKNQTVTKSNSKQMAELARKACRKQFGAGSTFRNFETYEGRIVRLWCFTN
jgi:hypothetical protein